MFSFTFLNSGVLILLSSAVIPILIYLFAKKKPLRIVFSSIRFIKMSQQKQNRKINLKNILLLIIRILIILLTIMAISRPAVKFPFLKGSSKHPPTAAVLIIDNSYSMDYLADTRTEMEIAKEIALSINEMLLENDLVSILTLDNRWNDLNGHIRYGKIDEKLITSINVTANHSPFSEVFEKAEKLIYESQLPNREIYFITDMQSTEIPQQKDIPLFIIPTSNITEKHNISCQNTFLANELINRRLEQKITFDLVNHSAQPQTDVIYSLYFNGRTVEEKVVSLEANQRRELNFNLLIDNSGWHSGFVIAKNERLNFDNKNFFSFFYNLSPKIAVVSDLQKLPIPLQSMLEVFTSSRENIKLVPDDKLYFDYLKDFDVVVVYARNELPASLSFLLDKLTDTENGIIFITDTNMNNQWKDYLSNKFSIEFREFYSANSRKYISNFNRFHKITRLLDADKIKLIGVTDFWETVTDDYSNTLIQVDNSSLILEKGNSYLWNFDPRALNNQLFVDSSFPIIAYKCFESASNSNSEKAAVLPGDRISIAGSSVILPSKNRLATNSDHLVITETGNYQLLRNEETYRIFSVNPDYSESEYKRLTIKSRDFLFVTEDNWDQEILRSRYGFEIWKYLLILALLLFVLEMLIVKKEERKI
ncbi:MAG: BatA domain-containing protein [Candidatus Cloacimonetes bacterium]|nr:BatA domain-containing protein [Candidatus Cloacimonadota bacterium]